MKKFMFLALFLSTIAGGVKAQSGSDFDRGVFDHLSMNVGFGTEGLSVGLAAPVTQYLELEAGMDFMFNFKVKGDLNLELKNPITVEGQSITLPDAQVRVEGKFARTQYHVKANVYPFGAKNALFVAAGCSFGGSKLAKITGHSDDVQYYMETYPQAKDQILNAVSAQLGDYQVAFDDNADISGDVRCNGFRPYLGLGYGRLTPKSGLGFRVELGCQFMGHLKVYQNDHEVNISKALENTKEEDDLCKIVDSWTVYPVVKFAIVGRFF